jgi:hypothetical protein
LTELTQLKPKPTIIILGKISPDKQEYQTCQVWPDLNLATDIDVFKLANEYPSPHSLTLVKGGDHKLSYGKRIAGKPSYFEAFGLDEVKLKTKYNVVKRYEFG